MSLLVSTKKSDAVSPVFVVASSFFVNSLTCHQDSWHWPRRWPHRSRNAQMPPRSRCTTSRSVLKFKVDGSFSEQSALTTVACWGPRQLYFQPRRPHHHVQCDGSPPSPPPSRYGFVSSACSAVSRSLSASRGHQCDGLAQGGNMLRHNVNQRGCEMPTLSFAQTRTLSQRWMRVNASHINVTCGTVRAQNLDGAPRADRVFNE